MRRMPTNVLTLLYAHLALILGSFAAVGFAPSAAANDVLTLATTTSTENSGLLAHIHPDFERRYGVRIKVIAKGTGASLQLARDGNADVILVHAREQEDAFVSEGYGVLRRDVMYNDFVLLGPSRDPARVGEVDGPAEALKRIAADEERFISRGDGSGTHIKEQTLWRQTRLPLETKKVRIISSGKAKEFSSVRPTGAWYLSIGQGMGKTLTMATERQAYALADRGTYYAFALAKPARTDLVVLCEGHASLHNPYGVIAVNPKKHPHVNHEAARLYIEWITSARVQRMIDGFQLQGKRLFHAGAASSGRKPGKKK